jgi:hypothetical protein
MSKFTHCTECADSLTSIEVDLGLDYCSDCRPGEYWLAKYRQERKRVAELEAQLKRPPLADTMPTAFDMEVQRARIEALEKRCAELYEAALVVERESEGCHCSYDPCGCGNRCASAIYDVLHDEFGNRRAALGGKTR